MKKITASNKMMVYYEVYANYDRNKITKCNTGIL